MPVPSMWVGAIREKLMTPAEALTLIQTRLATEPPVVLIEQLAPRTHAEAVTWARRLPLWDEYRGEFPDQAVSLARAVSRRAMREFGLVFDAEGRVVEQKSAQPPKPRETRFPMRIGEQKIEVRFQPGYFSGTDLFSFVGQEIVPPDTHPVSVLLGSHKPHALSGSGWWSHYAPHDVVEACGGPGQYAALYAEARLAGEEKAFEAVLNGTRPEEKASSRKASPAPVIGQHTAALVEVKHEERREPARQKELFS